MRITVGGRPETPVPAQLPPAPAIFVGRDAELAGLDRFLAEGGRAPDAPAVVVVTGLGGVGKTSLALSWLHRVRDRFPDGQLYVDLRGPVPPGEVLERFLRALGTPPEHLPSTLDEQVAAFRTAAAGRRLLIMLDNAISAAQVRTVLPASGHGLVLATSRARLSGLVVEGARYADLDPLGPDAAVDLLHRLVGGERARAEPAAAARLVALCGRLPIAVCASAARLARRPRLPIASLVGELADARHRLAVLSADDELSPRAAFDVSYASLAADEARLYRMLGRHPGPSFAPGAAAAAGGLPAETARRLLDRLAAAGLVTAEAGGRFRLHDLVHLHARETSAAADPPELRAAAFTRIAFWYLRTAVAADLVVVPGRWHLGPMYEPAKAAPPAYDGPAAALDRLDDELPNLRALLGQAHEEGRHDLVWQLCEALWGLFLHRKHYAAWVETHELGLASARACADPRAESRMLGALSVAHLNLRNFERALALSRRAAALERSAGSALGEAAARERIGLAWLGMHRPERSIEEFTRARAIHQGLGRRRGIALMTRRLGEAYRDTGRYDLAAAHLAEACGVFRDLGEPYLQARTLTELGRVHLLAGRPRPAAGALARALALVTGLGARYEQAQIRLLLAELATAGGDPAGARAHLETALEIFTELGAPQRQRVRWLLDGLPPGR
ncbi:NTPase [Sphaerisporangium rufum]|uniref:NTPase n=1 Tax=Sphaerisporangium rufum TaxID=1381558 RepID=A0A919QZU7_9ACTN|nr:tetratricopeptide repeat protein [Sphaerisporangium rufum]GII75811.1 NTPase [Sphaerisporangium rufum]